MAKLNNVEDGAKLFLKRRLFRQDVICTKFATSFFSLRGIQVDHFSDVGQVLKESIDREVNSRLGGFPSKQCAQGQRQNAVKSVDAEFLIGPMEVGREANPVGVFHLFECILGMTLSPTAQNDFFATPGVIVGAQDTLPEASLLELIVGFEIRFKGEIETALGGLYNLGF